MEKRINLVFVLLILSGLVSANDEIKENKKNPIVNLFEAPLKAFQTKPGEAIAVFQPEIYRQADAGDNNQTSSWFQTGQSIGSQVSSLTGWLANRLLANQQAQTQAQSQSQDENVASNVVTTTEKSDPDVLVEIQQIRPNQNQNIKIKRRKPVKENSDLDFDDDFDNQLDDFNEQQRIDDEVFENDDEYDDDQDQDVTPNKNKRRQLMNNRNQNMNRKQNMNQNQNMNQGQNMNRVQNTNRVQNMNRNPNRNRNPIRNRNPNQVIIRNQNTPRLDSGNSDVVQNPNQIRVQNLKKLRKQQQLLKQEQQKLKKLKNQLNMQQMQQLLNGNQYSVLVNNNGGKRGFNGNKRYTEVDDEDYEDDDDAYNDSKDDNLESNDYKEEENDNDNLDEQLDDYDIKDEKKDDNDDLDYKDYKGDDEENDYKNDGEDEYVDLIAYEPQQTVTDTSNQQISGFRPIESIPIGGNGHINRIIQMNQNFPTNIMKRREQLLQQEFEREQKLKQQQKQQQKLQQQQIQQKQQIQQQQHNQQKQQHIQQKKQQQELQNALLNNQHIIIPIHFVPDSIPNIQYTNIAPQGAPQPAQIQVVAQHLHTVQNTGPGHVIPAQGSNYAQGSNHAQGLNHEQASTLVTRQQNKNKNKNIQNMNNKIRNQNNANRQTMKNRNQGAMVNQNRNQGAMVNQNRFTNKNKNQGQQAARKTTEKPSNEEVYFNVNLLAPGPATSSNSRPITTRPTRRPPTRVTNLRTSPKPKEEEEEEENSFRLQQKVQMNSGMKQDKNKMNQDKNRPDAMPQADSDEMDLQETPPQYLAPAGQSPIASIGDESEEEDEDTKPQARSQFYLPQQFYQILGSDKYLTVGQNGRFLLKSARSLDLNKEEKSEIEHPAKIVETTDVKVSEIEKPKEPVEEIKPIELIKPVENVVLKDAPNSLDAVKEDTKLPVSVKETTVAPNVIKQKHEAAEVLKPEEAVVPKSVEHVHELKEEMEKEIDDGSISTTTEKPFIVKDDVKEEKSSTVAPIVLPSLNKAGKVLLRSEIVRQKENGARFLVKSEQIRN